MILALLLSVTAVAAPPADLPTPSQVAVHRVLSARHFSGCAPASAASETPVQDLIAVAETSTMPPWAALRAARCLVVDHAAEARPDLERWVTSAEQRGLGIVVLSALDEAPLEVAIPVAQAALTGPDPADVRRRLLSLQAPELRELGGEVTP